MVEDFLTKVDRDIAETKDMLRQLFESLTKDKARKQELAKELNVTYNEFSRKELIEKLQKAFEYFKVYL